MFLRIRGKGASPENSQAALLHLRGFRHTHTQPISSSYSVALAPDELNGDEKRWRPYRYAHFPMGIQATGTLKAQVAFLTKLAEAASAHPSKDAAAVVQAAPLVESSTAAVLSTINDETQRMIWKETWNVYDIVYDEVNLLPPDFDATNTLLKTLAQAERADNGGSGSMNTVIAASECLDTFTRPLSTSGNKLVLVSTHYFHNEAIPLESWMQTPCVNTSNPAAHPLLSPLVLVVDLSGVKAEDAYQKLALELAWSTAYATTQTDNPLLRATSIVVRLPYDEVPCAIPWLAEKASTTPSCEVVLQLYDFIGEHIALLYRGLWLSSAELTQRAGVDYRGPPVHFIGKMTNLAEDTIVQSLLRGSEQTGAAVQSKPSLPIVVLGCDTNPALSSSAENMADTWGVPVSVLVAPVQALLDGGDEPWDPYTQKERERLNFCPCCGDCDHSQEASHNGHSHGHGHGQ